MLSSQPWLAKLGGAANALIKHFGGPGVMLLAIGDSSFLSFPEGNDIITFRHFTFSAVEAR